MVGVLGFCLGGGFALLCARGHAFEVSAVNYGTVPKDMTDLLRDACPIIANFGSEDRYLGNASRRLERELSEAKIPHEVNAYSGVGHAFMKGPYT